MAEPIRKFVFDTVFDEGGEIIAAPRPVKRVYTPAEVEALVAAARHEAREEALAEVANLRAQALSVVAEGVVQALPALARSAQTHREGSAELSLAAARVIAGAALDRFPQAPLNAAIEALGGELHATPRLVVRSIGLDEAVRADLEAACADAGFTGQIAFRDDPAMPVAAFTLEWSDGRAAFDPAAVADRIAETLTAALASEAGHAESLAITKDGGS